MGTEELILYIKKNILRLHRDNAPTYRIFQPELDRLYICEGRDTSYILIVAVRHNRGMTVELEAVRTGIKRTVRVPRETDNLGAFFNGLIYTIRNIYRHERETR